MLNKKARKLVRTQTCASAGTTSPCSSSDICSYDQGMMHLPAVCSETMSQGELGLLRWEPVSLVQQI